MKIRLASSNRGKIREFRKLLPEDFEIKLADLPEGTEIPETGSTFEENAAQKAEAYAVYYPDEWIVAEDSGLAVDLLDGAPGIYSSRYGGPDADYPGKFAKLWSDLEKKDSDPSRWTARYVSVLAVRSPQGDISLYRGECRGRIHPEAKGEDGFGYDPVFYLPQLGMTVGEMTEEQKNRISHRAEAVRKYLLDLEEYV